MSINVASTASNAFIVTPGANINVGNWLSSEAAASGQQNVVVLGLDRSEYTVGEAGDTGTFSGNGQTTGFSVEGGDARVACSIFTYDAATGQYENAALGALNQLQYTASASIGEMANISLYSSQSAPDMNNIISDPYDYIYGSSMSNYIGSCSIVTLAAATGASSYATPDTVAAAAQAEVGTVANSEGCWILASTIADVAGAALPVSSAAAGGGGQSNGQWGVAYDGSVQANANWADHLQTGDIVDFITTSGGGHITTVAAGSGENAKLIDNITYSIAGYIENSASDGNPNDIIVQPAHDEATEFNGVDPTEVVVYRLLDSAFSTTCSGGVMTTTNIENGTSTVTVANADNTIMLSAGTVTTGTGGNTVVLGDGACTVQSGGSDTIFGGAGINTVVATGDAIVVGGTGALTYIGSHGHNVVFAGSGGLTYTGRGGMDDVIGTGQAVNVDGGSGCGVYSGGGGSTIRAGSGGVSVLLGADGAKLYSTGSAGDLFGAGATGNLLMDGISSTGNDVFFGSAGTGTLTFITGSGDDLLALGQGTNAVTLGSGHSVVFANTGTTGVSNITLGSGSTDINLGGKSVDMILTATGAGRVVNLYNYVAGADVITLTGYSSIDAASAIATQTAHDGSVSLNLGGAGSVNLIGVSHVTSALFT